MFKIVVIVISFATQQVQVGIDPDKAFRSYEDCIVAAIERTEVKERQDALVVAFSCVKTNEEPA